MKALIKKTDTHFEAILASYMDDSITLTDFQKKMKERIKSAFTYMLNWRSRQQVAKLLIENFDISTATAYRDISMALRIYGDVNKADKEGMRFILIEYNHNLMQMAAKEKNLEVMGKCIDRSMKLVDFDKEDNLVNLEKLANMDIEIKLSKSSEKALQGMMNQGVVDLNNFEIEDVEYEDAEIEEMKGESDES